jgi:hypothetical protein
MTTSPSLSLLLFGETRVGADVLAPALRRAAPHTDGRILHAIVDHLVQAELDVALDRACGTRVSDVLLQGWHQLAVLETAARASLDAPGTEQPVALGRHAITAEQHPELELLVSGVPALTLPLALVARIEVLDVVAVVSGGALVALHGGQVDLTLELSAAEVPLAAATSSLDLDTAFPLPAPIDLRGQQPLIPQARQSQGSAAPSSVAR